MFFHPSVKTDRENITCLNKVIRSLVFVSIYCYVHNYNAFILNV